MTSTHIQAHMSV